MPLFQHKPYARTTHDGNVVNWRTKAMLLEMEDRLGYKLTVVQGSYNGGVGASAGTHDGGGAVDLAPFDWRNKVRVGRAVGFDIWHRPELHAADGSLIWHEHIHGIADGDKQASSEARGQMAQYRAHTDGLAGHGPDNFPFHPDPPVVFDFAEWQRRQRLSLRLKRLIRRREQTRREIRRVRLAIRRNHGGELTMSFESSHKRRAVERKVYAASLGGTTGGVVSTFALWLLGALLFGGSTDAGSVDATLAAVPYPVSAVVTAALAGLGALAAGYRAKATDDTTEGEVV